MFASKDERRTTFLVVLSFFTNDLVASTPTLLKDNMHVKSCNGITCYKCLYFVVNKCLCH